MSASQVAQVLAMYEPGPPSTPVQRSTPTLDPQTLGSHMSGRSNDNGSLRTPDLTRDDFSPLPSPGLVTPSAAGAGWPSLDSHLVVHSDWDPFPPSDEQEVPQKPQAANALAPTPDEPAVEISSHTLNPWLDSHLQSTGSEDIMHDTEAHQQYPVRPVEISSLSSSSDEEEEPSETTLGDDPVRTPLDDENQQEYWTVNPFQNPITSGRQQEPTSTLPLHMPQVQSVDDPLKTLSRFCLDTAPRQLYLHLLLRLPYLYFSRLTLIFRDAKLSLPEMRKLALLAWVQRYYSDHNSSIPGLNSNPAQSEAFMNLRSNWESFIDSLMAEWKINNIVSVLLLSAILTTLQIDGVSNDPISRSAALIALVCGMMSLLYGCMYIVRFGTMRKGYKAIQWAEVFTDVHFPLEVPKFPNPSAQFDQEAQQTETRIFWNVWVFLAMPAIWLSWSIILFMTSVMAYVWRTGSNHDPVLQISPTMALAPRLAVTGTFAFGMLYFGLIVYTLRRYGDIMDVKWKKRVASWVKENIPREAYMRRPQRQYSQAVPWPATSPFDQMPLPSGNLQLFSPNSHITPASIPGAIASADAWGMNYSSTATPPMLPGRYTASGNLSVTNQTNNIMPAALSLPYGDPSAPNPASLIPSAPVLGSLSSSIVAPWVDLKLPRFLRSGDPSQHELRQVENLANIYKAILPVMIAGLNPFGLVPALPKPDIVAGTYFTTTRVMSLSTPEDNVKIVPEDLLARGFANEDWGRFITDMELAWKNQHPVKQVHPCLNSEYLALSSYPRRQDFIASFLHWWNLLYFSVRATEALLCEEFSTDSPWKSNFAIYLVGRDSRSPYTKITERFGPLVGGLQKINIYRPLNDTLKEDRSDEILGSQPVLDFPSPTISNPILPFHAIKVTAFQFRGAVTVPHTLPFPIQLSGRDVDEATWNRFIKTMQNNWIHEAFIDQSLLDPWEYVPQYTSLCKATMKAWNTDYFLPRKMEAVFCREMPNFSHAIYLTDSSTGVPVHARFGAHPPGITDIRIYTEWDFYHFEDLVWTSAIPPVDAPVTRHPSHAQVHFEDEPDSHPGPSV